ncbi:MAG: NUDIX hydrolase [Nitrospinae bacterium CG11_big_fil_rev_8_21_14_0_20_56_8]|nr:MAG: NUDIX hydrolase [Nitrospinae bacterium CG11_big_fil_rev_8_21_14_0_20_56_8]
MDVGEEIYDVVDLNDCVLGQATRREIHARSLYHRSVHVLVFNPAGDLFLQKRSHEKDENPGLWDTSSAGHVDAGETYEDSAVRELFEELGIHEELKPFLSLNAGPETFWEHVRVFTCTTRKTIRVNPREISEGRYWTLPEIREILTADPAQITSTFKIIFNIYLTRLEDKYS